MTTAIDRRTFISAIAASGFASEREAASADWPQFKFDSARSGDNPAARLSFPMKRILAFRFPAPIYASPAVVEDRVYLQDAHGNAACIDSKARKVIWTASLGGFNNVSSPAVFQGKVYLGSTTSNLVVLEATTGKILQRIETNGPVNASPAVSKESVYFSTLNGKLYKCDLDGKVVWTFDGGKTSLTEIAVKGDRIAFFAGTTNTIQYLLRDLGAKVEVLQKRPSSEQTCPTSGPTFVGDNDYAYQCFDSEFGSYFLTDRILTVDVQDTRGVSSVRGRKLYRGDKCWDLDAIEPEKLKKHPQQGGIIPKPLWRSDPQFLYDGGFHSSPALAKEHLVIGSELGKLLVFELESKEAIRKPVWSFETTRAGQVNGGISSSPAVVNGRIFFGGEDGILYGLGQGDEAAVVDVPFDAKKGAASVKLTGDDWPTPGGDMGFHFIAPPSSLKPPFAVKWRTRLWSTFKCPMIVADSKVFCGGRSGLLAALDASNGAILWKTHHPGVESRCAPTYADGKLLLLRVRCNQGDSPHVVGASGGPTGEGVWCHDAKTGAKIWHRPIPFAYQFNVDGLAVHDGKVYCCETDTAGQLFALALSTVDGKEVHRVKLEGIVPGKNRPVRFSGVIADGVWCVALKSWGKDRTGAAFALDPATGKILWRKDGLGLDIRSRVAARKGVVVVFNKEGAHAFEPRTGKPLWVGVSLPKGSSETFSMQPLTDEFLESKGQKGQVKVGGCHNPIYLNGLFYLHDPRSQYSSNFMVVQGEQNKLVWQLGFLSNACPSPTPAYESLYYAPNAEGVIYCFENAK